MAENMQKSSVAFSVSGKIGEQGCLSLLRTGHATHVESVLDMFRTRAIRSELIDDDSRLDTERTKVVFTSPHDWPKPWGCMFGTVVLQLNWAKVTEDKNFYWIWGNPYTTTRPRILITDKE